MTPRRLDKQIVTRRLHALHETLDQLRSLDGTTASQLESDPVLRAAAERFLQVSIDLAIDINAHLVSAIEGVAPESGRDSFLRLAELGVLDEAAANVLAPCSGFRNVLVHRYTDIRVELVAQAIADALARFPHYATAIATFVASQS